MGRKRQRPVPEKCLGTLFPSGYDAQCRREARHGHHFGRQRMPIAACGSPPTAADYCATICASGRDTYDGGSCGMRMSSSAMRAGMSGWAPGARAFRLINPMLPGGCNMPVTCTVKTTIRRCSTTLSMPSKRILRRTRCGWEPAADWRILTRITGPRSRISKPGEDVGDLPYNEVNSIMRARDNLACGSGMLGGGVTARYRPQA